MTTRINIKHNGPHYHRAAVVTERMPTSELGEGEACDRFVYGGESVFVHESTVDTASALRSLLAVVEARATPIDAA